MWRDGVDPTLLPSYQAAFRELEALIAEHGDDRRHHFVIVIPVADSPRHLHNCLDSLLALCRSYAYGLDAHGRFAKTTVLIADDSAEAESISRQRDIVAAFADAGIDTHYFGIEEQLALLDRVRDLDLCGVVGEHPRNAFGHKGQGMMRNIAYLRLAEMQAQMPDQRLLFYSIDADQEFRVKVPTADGGQSLCAVNFLYEIDRVFEETDAWVLTGKVVGDPPVSPAVMAGNFVTDVLAFLREMAGVAPHQAYRQPGVDTSGSGEAAYHDMAELFGFDASVEAYRYRCPGDTAPTNAACFAEFAGHLDRFFHGEHPTRVTWYRHVPVLQSVQSARTVYTGNYVFSPSALEQFIPFAPLRLRMSGPTMGRLLQARLGERFVSANVPMLHGRTLDETRRSEFRPGVHTAEQRVDLCDEFERQFFGDVMLFSIDRLMAMGEVGGGLSREGIAAVRDAVEDDMRDRYRLKQSALGERLGQLRALLHDPQQWWRLGQVEPAALRSFESFIDNVAHNFGVASPCLARTEDVARRDHWRNRQLDAIAHLEADREVWQAALQRLRDRALS